ncbi:MAG TPA: carboxypeptidase regulatory-like domain-containing protein, partial [Candidatus Bathyarchaeia archaeon]|nr:carboxypeptidase regulatory-like domain-containing protein [Candidatus Bathyarchaeia archaeon]
MHFRGAQRTSARRPQAGRVSAIVATLILIVGLFVPASTLAATTTISGKVTDTGGAALSGITVQPGTISASAFTAVGSSATTAGDGSYSVTVGDGRFAIRFSEGSQAHAMGFYSSAGFVVDAGSATTILATGGAVTGINVRMPVTHLITGTVTGNLGVALNNVTVAALTIAGNQVVTATTNVSGVYNLHVASGTYVVRFNPSGGSGYPSGYYTVSGLTTDLSAAAHIAVGSSDSTGKDIQLPLARTIQGTVTDPSSAPLAGITVSAGLSTTTTSAGGTYTLSVPPGSYRVTFQDLSNALPSGFYSTGGFTASFSGATLVDVNSGPQVGINVQLPTGVAMTGTVTGAAGAGLAGINVWLIPTGTTNPLSIVTTSPGGTYSIPAAAGTFIVKFVENTGAYS